MKIPVAQPWKAGSAAACGRPAAILWPEPTTRDIPAEWHDLLARIDALERKRSGHAADAPRVLSSQVESPHGSESTENKRKLDSLPVQSNRERA